MSAGAGLMSDDLFSRFSDIEYARRYCTVHVIQPNPITRDFKAGLQPGAAVLVTQKGGEPPHNYPFKFPVCRLFQRNKLCWT